MNDNACIISEQFHYVCGHIATWLTHNKTCKQSQLLSPLQCTPYLSSSENGQILNITSHTMKDLRFKWADIIEDKCLYCKAVENNLLERKIRIPFVGESNTWISDLGIGEHQAVSPPELVSRRKFWHNYAHDQRVLFKRQHDLEKAHLLAWGKLESYDLRPKGKDPEVRHQLLQNASRASKLKGFYDLDKNIYLSIVRSMGTLEMFNLFDSKNLTSLSHDLTRIVKSEDVPSGEDCAICTETLDPIKHSDKVLRLFCGNHLFHEKCIVMTFDMNEGKHQSCPLCRKTRNFYLPPSEQSPFLQLIKHTQVLPSNQIIDFKTGKVLDPRITPARRLSP